MKHPVHTFVLIAFLAGIIAPACGFAWGGKFSVVEICTTEGIEQRLVENDQQDGEHVPSAENDCLFCFQTANFSGFLPEAIVSDVSYIVREEVFKRDELAFFNSFSFDHGARAPPSPLV